MMIQMRRIGLRGWYRRRRRRRTGVSRVFIIRRVWWCVCSCRLWRNHRCSRGITFECGRTGLVERRGAVVVAAVVVVSSWRAIA